MELQFRVHPGSWYVLKYVYRVPVVNTSAMEQVPLTWVETSARVLLKVLSGTSAGLMRPNCWVDGSMLRKGLASPATSSNLAEVALPVLW
jgi:hypothetical protein